MGNRLFDLPYIGIDDEAAMYALTARLAEEVSEGDILYFTSALKDGLHTENAQRYRLRGFTKAADDLGKSARVVTDLSDVTDFSGIVCSTDYYALQVLRHLGYPKEIRIAGFDKISFLQSIPSPILSVEYSTDRIAEECTNYLLGRRFCEKKPAYAGLPHAVSSKKQPRLSPQIPAEIQVFALFTQKFGAVAFRCDSPSVSLFKIKRQKMHARSTPRLHNGKADAGHGTADGSGNEAAGVPVFK